MALSEINETHPYKSAYGHGIGHDMSCPNVTYVIWRSEQLNKLAACSTMLSTPHYQVERAACSFRIYSFIGLGLCRTCSCSPVFTFQSRTTPLVVDAARVSPSGEKATELTSQLFCIRDIRSDTRIFLSITPVSTSHSLTLPSQLLPPARILPSGEKATEITGPPVSVITFSCLPFWTSHRRIVPSQLPLAKIPPSGENAKDSVALLCPPQKPTLKVVPEFFPRFHAPRLFHLLSRSYRS